TSSYSIICHFIRQHSPNIIIFRPRGTKHHSAHTITNQTHAISPPEQHSSRHHQPPRHLPHFPCDRRDDFLRIVRQFGRRNPRVGGEHQFHLRPHRIRR